MAREMNRREAISLGIGALVSLSLPVRALDGTVLPLVQAHDAKMQLQLDRQVTDAQSRWCGAVPDGFGIHYCHTAAELLKDCAASYFHPHSAHHGSGALLERMKLLAGFLARFQNAEGNIDLFATNFNSPPDTGFVVHHVATAAKLAQINGDDALLSPLKDFLLRAGQGLSKGGFTHPTTVGWFPRRWRRSTTCSPTANMWRGLTSGLPRASTSTPTASTPSGAPPATTPW